MAPSAVDAAQPVAVDELVSKVKAVEVSPSTTSSSATQAALSAAVTRYEARNPASKALHERAVESLPGGNTRTLLHTSPFPVFMKKGEGYQVTSEDGHT